MHNSPEAPNPFVPVAGVAGLGLTLLGQVSSSGSAGIAGVIMSCVALLGAGFQYFKAILDAKQRDKQIEELGRDLRQTRSDLADSRQRRHAEAGRLNAIILKLEVKVASLEGRLGIIDHTHTNAINVNSDDTDYLADQMDIKFPQKMQHLEETNGESKEPEYDEHGNRLIHEPPSDL